MKTVTQQFTDEQNAETSKGIRWNIMAYANGESKDLTPYLKFDSLSRIDWRIEEDLTAFTSPDFQCSLWYDETIWNWLKDNDLIRIVVKTGFDFELHQSFWGYVDKDNLQRESLGIIYLRVFSFTEYLKLIKTEDVVFQYGGASSTYAPMQDIVRDIFDHLNLTDQTIKILPVDSYPNAENYVASYFHTALTISTDRNKVCQLNDTTFFFTDNIFLYHVKFNDDYSEITITNIDNFGAIENIIKWDDDNVAVVQAIGKQRLFKSGSGWVPELEYEISNILLYDEDGIQTDSWTINSFDAGSMRYYPKANTFYRFHEIDYYVVFYNGAPIATPNNIDRLAIKIFDANTHTEVQVWYDTTHYHHPLSQATVAHSLARDYYFTFLCDSTDYYANALIFVLKREPNAWSYTAVSTAATCLYYSGALESLGRYVSNDGVSAAFNVYTNEWESNFWATTIWLGKAVYHSRSTIRVDENPHQILIGYYTPTDSIEIKTMDINENITTEIISDVLPADYTMKTGWTYWRTYKDKPCMLGILTNPDNYPNVVILANQFFPFVKLPPLNDRETVAETLRLLATAGCCVFYFPNENAGVFISRTYWDGDNVYKIMPSLYNKEWNITTQMPRMVIVKSGSMEVSVGEEMKSLTISSDYIPDYDDNLGKAYAQFYYDFLSDNPILMEIDTDFLIQFEPFDSIEVLNANGDTYQGRLMRTIQEGMKITMCARGEKL